MEKSPTTNCLSFSVLNITGLHYPMMYFIGETARILTSLRITKALTVKPKAYNDYAGASRVFLLKVCINFSPPS